MRMYLVKLICGVGHIDDVDEALAGGHSDRRGTLGKDVDEGG